MSVNSFIPQIWVASLLRELEKSLVFRSLTNNNYESDAQNADSVILNQVSNPSISTYDPAVGVTFSDLQTTSQTLLLDQKKSFAFTINNIDKAQVANGGALMTAAMQGAAYGWQDTVDTALAGEYANAGIKGGSNDSALGTTASALEITADGGGTSVAVVDWLSRLARRYNESNAPDNIEKILPVPPWLEQKMVKAKILDNRGIDNNGTYENGSISKAYGFTLKMSNNVSNNGTNYRIMAGNSNCITFADQIRRIKAGERDEFFEDYLTGLYVYGFKTVRSDQLMASIVTEGTEGQ